MSLTTQAASAADWQDHIQPMTRRWLIGAGFLQGLFVYLLLERLPDSTPYSLQFTMYSLLIAVPWLLLVIAEDVRDTWLWYLVAAYGLVLAGTASYTGGQCTPVSPAGCDPEVILPFAASQLLVWCLVTFVFRTLLEQRSAGLAYPLLFKYSWHNFFIVVLASVYTLLLWLLLFLGAGLFKLVELDFFWRLLRQEWFALPLTGTALAYGAVVARQQLTVVTTLRRLLRTLIGSLLPLVALISASFLVVLPFTGVQPLWDTNRASLLMLWLVALLLFFANAEVQYGDDRALARGWRLLIRGALTLLPVYLLLTGFALWLRIDQYGWSVARVWGVIVSLVFAGFTLSYAVSIVTRWNAWSSNLGRINTLLLGVMIAVLVATNTPLLNVSRIVATSQVERLLSGATSAKDFDYHYLNRRLGRSGQHALEGMREDPRFQTLPEAERVAIAWKDRHSQPRAFSVADDLVLLPAELEVPDALYTALEEAARRFFGQCSSGHVTCYLSRVSLRTGAENFLLLLAAGPGLSGQVFEEVDGQWQVVGHLNDYRQQPGARGPQEPLGAADIRVAEPDWKDILIDGRRLRIQSPANGLLLNSAIGTPLPVPIQSAPAQPLPVQ